MTEAAVENPVVENKPNKFAMVISCLLAFPLAAVLLV
ncbi:MAG: cytochrome bd biosynthesis protein, partial [Acinetobacter sp.]